LAFGQTGSGKTHTMTGPPQQVNSTSPVAMVTKMTKHNNNLE